MTFTYRAEDWDRYKMVYREPHREIEPPEREIAVVDAALATLVEARILPRADYDGAKMIALRETVKSSFEIPWTAITPRMQRLIYAINAIARPQRLIAAGCFCGNTFICNAGAAVGPGAAYSAAELVGIEIKADEAERAERNIRKIDATGVARVVAADAVPFAAGFSGQIDLLYLDADGAGGRGKGIYLDILEAALAKIPAGGLVLAHNSVNAAEKLRYYLEFVRDAKNFKASANMIVDGEGLEVSVR